METFKGTILRGPTEWINTGCISANEMQKRPINYLEIGVLHGSNLLQVINILLKHPLSKAYAIDPWIDYDEYSEYKKDTTQYDNESNFNICMNNIKNHANAKQAPYMHNNKLTIIRDMSDNAIPKLEDNFFDIIYIDGNHKTEFVYNDATNVLSKLKNGGILIFDDSSWKDVSVGIDKFINENSDKIVHIGKVRDNEQAIYRKL
jgi:hypothetical protein